MKQNLIKLFSILCIFACAGCFMAEARSNRAKATRCNGTLEFKCDSIDFRTDLTRVYGKLVGKPHTSNRIDAVQLRGSKAIADDIDGVDMKRWFQWEDDGIIPVEIDFPAMKFRSSVEMEVTTPRGATTWIVDVAPVQVVKRKAKRK